MMLSRIDVVRYVVDVVCRGNTQRKHEVSKGGHSEVRCSQHGESEMEPSVMQSGVEIGEGARVL